MKKSILKPLSILLIISLFVSSFAGTFYAANKETDATKCKTSNRILGATGDIAVDPDSLPDYITVIESVSDYYKATANKTENKKDVAMTKADTLPSFVDNSTSPYFPAIGNQGGIGSCQYWAQIYYQFTYTMNKELGIRTTPENTFSPQWGYNLKASTDDMVGIYYEVYEMMRAQGNVFQSQVPYTEDVTSVHPKEEIWKTSIKYRLKDFQRFEDIGDGETIITSPDDPDLIPIKTAVANGDVLAYSTYIYSWDYQRLKTNANAPENNKYNNEEVIHGVTDKEGSHRMTIVGYNDNIWTDINYNDKVDSGEMGAFKISNSWGSEWGNKGFMWVAYDALNKVSFVKDAPTYKQRIPAFSEIARINVIKPEEHLPVYVQYTLNTADRTQTKLTMHAEKDGTINSRQVYSNIYNGDKIAYDGQKTATDATMIALLSNTTEELTSETINQYSISVSAEDMTDDDKVLTVKDIRIVDEKGGKVYTAENAFPFTLNGETKTIKFTESDLNHAVVYYLGYKNPQIHFKVQGDTDFTSAPLSESEERRGYTHKYVIDLKDKDSVTFYFSDNEGNKDDNNGKYYTAIKGVNFYRTERVGEKLTATLSCNFNGEIDVDRACDYIAKASGGFAPYLYQFTFTHLESGEQTVEAFDDQENQTYYFRKEGKYEVKLEIKDFSDAIATQTIIVEVKDIPFSFEKMYTERKSNLVGNTVDIISITQNEKIRYTGRPNNTYTYVVTDENGNICAESTVLPFKYSLPERYTHSKFSFVPHKSGTYKATVSSTDNNQEYAEYSVTFKVFDKKYGDSNSDGEISVMDATLIQRMLAGVVAKDDVNEELSDVDANSDIDVMDATLIQRYMAQLSGTKNTGIIIEYIPPIEPTEPPTEPPQPTEPPTQPPVNRTVTFTNSFNWGGTISCYYWSDSDMAMTSWPGVKMTPAGINDYGQSMYTFEVPKGATYIIFTNGSNQTVDIPYTGGNIRYYPISSTNTSGHHFIGTW